MQSVYCAPQARSDPGAKREARATEFPESHPNAPTPNLVLNHPDSSAAAIHSASSTAIRGTPSTSIAATATRRQWGATA